MNPSQTGHAKTKVKGTKKERKKDFTWFHKNWAQLPTDEDKMTRKKILKEPKLQKDYFGPVSGFSTGKCPNHVFGQFCHNLRHKSNHRLLFF